MNVFLFHDEAGNISQFMKTNLDEIEPPVGLFVKRLDVDADSFFLSPDKCFLDVGDEVKLKPEPPGVFYIWAGRDWIFDHLTAVKKISETINSKRELSFLQPILFLDHLFDSDSLAVTNIQSTLLIFQDTKTLPDGFLWRTHDNRTVPMTYQKLEGLAQSIYARNAQIYAEYWALKDSLSSKTESELLAIHESLTRPPG